MFQKTLFKIIIIVFLLSLCCLFFVNICQGGNTTKQIELDFLFKTGCLKCIKVEKQLIELKKRTPFLVINKHNVKNTDSFEEIINLINQYSVPESQGFLTPAVFIGKHYYIKNDIDIDEIELLIKRHQSTVSQPIKVSNSIQEATSVENGKPKENFIRLIHTKLSSFSYLTVLLAGLIDGVNPCAFALLIFFLSYLKIAGRTRRQLIEVGLTYSISMFITYFLIGLGFFHGLKVIIAKYSYIAVVMYVISGLIALLCAVLSFWDIYKLSIGQTKDVKLQLGEKTKKITHKLIRNNARGAYVIIGAVIIAVGVSFLELGCTGQVYLPIISFILQQKIDFSKALTLLLVYNTAFILPLLFIFGLAVFGMTHVGLSKWFQNNLIKIKLITGILFLFLGVIIFAQIFF